MAANWSELDHNLLIEIAQRIRIYRDFLAFRYVCTTWRSAAVIENFKYKSSQIPWLMLAQRKNTNVRDFFDISRNKVTRQVVSPEAKVRKCFSSKGWFFTIAKDLSINLLHPFSRKQISLPGVHIGLKNWELHRVYQARVNFILKCVLSSSPSYTSDYVAMVIFGGYYRLAFLKSGDEAWTIFETCGACSDIIYHKENFYAITYMAHLLVFGVDNLTVVKEIIEMPPELCERICLGNERLYVVESVLEGTLLVVVRKGVSLSDDDTYGTYGFEVFELNLSSKTWTTVNDLGNRAIFLGHNSSFSIEASKDTQCHANSIYFTDDCFTAYWVYRRGGGKDMGIYNMTDKSIIQHFSGNSFHPITPPMWVEQTFE